MRSTTFITFAVTVFVFLSFTDASPLKGKQDGLLNEVRGGERKLDPVLTYDLRTGEKAPKKRDDLFLSSAPIKRNNEKRQSGKGGGVSRGNLKFLTDVNTVLN